MIGHKEIIVKRHPMGKKFLAICLCGLIFSVRKLNKTELNHELIHVAQQREMLYIPFFIWYVVEWLVLLVKYRNWMEAYYHIRFEQEAYRHQADNTYLQHRKCFSYLR